ncbi:MAG: ABC transporter ATP-binding protein [Pyrinomonadaceae bacterium]
MNDFPLTSFLITLASDGILVSQHDYERLILALKTPGGWSHTQLRGVMSALLTHNPEQAEIFRKRFDAFFAEVLPLAEAVTEEHVRGVTEELLRIKSGEFNDSLPERPTSDSLPSRWQAETELDAVKERVAEGEEGNDETLLTRLWRLHGYKLILVGVIILLTTLIATGLRPFIPDSLRQTLTEIFSSKKADSDFAINANNQNSATGTAAPATTAQPRPNAGALPGGNQNQVGTPTPNTNTNAQTGSSVAPTTLANDDAGSWFPFALILTVIAAAIASLSALLFVSLQMRRRPGFSIRLSKPLSFDPYGPNHFTPKKIGGPPSPQMGAVTLDYLCKGLNYLLSESHCNRLDVKASVHATGRNAGMYTLSFYKRKRLVNVYILEDAYAEPCAWNTVARELATGLHRRGADVRYGRYYGSLQSFQMEDGGTLWFEELERERNESLILFFSDGKHLTRRRDGFFLEALRRWPAVVWLDTREKKFWDESAQLIRHFGIPLYPADEEGTTRALRRFVTEHDLGRQDAVEAAGWKGVRASAGLPLDVYVKDLVGEEAIAWAQACSMIQPLSLGMADALRREYAPHLPPGRIERLFRLPKTSWTAAGLHFSLPVLSVLREDFLRSWSVREQEDVLAFIIEHVRREEPPEKGSLRYLTWWWALEKIRLESEPDSALESLAKLSTTPLGDRVKRDFSVLYLPDEEMPSQDRLRLRLRPETARGLLYFQQLSGRGVSVSGLSFVEGAKVIWYEALRVLELMRSIELRLTLEKIRKLVVPSDDAPQAPLAAVRSPNLGTRSSGRPRSVLRVNNLQTYFAGEDGVVKAVDGVSFDLDAGEVLGLVGESGCGKSVTALSIMRLVSPPGEILGGEVWFKHEDLLEVSESRMRKIRGNRIAMIFQDPMTSLNPFHTVGRQIAESLRIHRSLSSQQAHEAAIEAMREVAIPDSAARANDYPHQFSGGMRQRIMIAMALACDPEVLIADEPTTALDLITQAQIVELLNNLRRTRKLSVLLITHDLSLIAAVADRVCVMYTGRVVEEAGVKEIFSNPRHPYTQGLLGSLPKPTDENSVGGRLLRVIEGAVPAPTDLPPGCHFAPRCPHRLELCAEEPVPVCYVGDRAEVRCVLYKPES